MRVVNVCVVGRGGKRKEERRHNYSSDMRKERQLQIRACESSHVLTTSSCVTLRCKFVSLACARFLFATFDFGGGRKLSV